jgi:hypothetical protein
VAERPVVPLKSGNADGGKGPQFKTNARSGKGQEIGQPANSNKRSETADGVTCQSEGRTRVPVLPPLRQDSSAGRTRLRLPKLQGQPGSSRSGWSAIRRHRSDWRRALARGTGGTAEAEGLPTGSGQTGLDTEAERQTAPLGDTDDHRPGRANGRDARAGTHFRSRPATGAIRLPGRAGSAGRGNSGSSTVEHRTPASHRCGSVRLFR